MGGENLEVRLEGCPYFLALPAEEKPIQRVRGSLSLKLGRILGPPVSYLACQG